MTKPLAVGDTVRVFDRYRFAIPLKATIEQISDVNDGVRAKLLESNNPHYPVGYNVWVHRQQLEVLGSENGMTKHKIYLAGPMSGLPEFNFPAFKKAAADLRVLGHYVFNPAEHDELVYGFDMEEIKLRANYRDCLRVDLNWILDHATAIALLPGWENSSGTAVEVALSKALKLPIIYL